MARIRTIKPEFFRHEVLFEAEVATKLPLRLAYAGLWTIADRDGRFRWQPRILKLDALPFDDCNFAAVLDALEAAGFLIKYEVAGEFYGFIPSWEKHQHVNQRESPSKYPSPGADGARICTHVHARGEKEGELEREGDRSDDRDARAPEPDPFDEFWEGYPNKTGKPKARSAYTAALKRASAAEILAGRDRYVRSKPPDRQWLNPATFLNQDRWADEPAIVDRPSTGPPGGGLGDDIRAAAERIRSRQSTAHEPTLLTFRQAG